MRNCHHQPPSATSRANTMRPARESGVVRGSEIMKKVKSSSAPFCTRCSGIVIGSCSHSERPTSRAIQAKRNVRATSARPARITTSPPRQAIRKAKNATLPHWPGLTHTRPSLTSMSSTSAMFVGLKRCLPRQRSANLDPMAMTAASMASHHELQRHSRHKDSPEMSALRHSKRNPIHFENSHWIPRTVAKIRDARVVVTSKSSATMP